MGFARYIADELQDSFTPTVPVASIAGYQLLSIRTRNIQIHDKNDTDSPRIPYFRIHEGNSEDG